MRRPLPCQYKSHKCQESERHTFGSLPKFGWNGHAMSKSPVVLKALGYASGASVAASLIVLLVAICAFGFEFAKWAEWQGRIAGVAATLAGVSGAVIGLRIALGTESRADR